MGEDGRTLLKENEKNLQIAMVLKPVAYCSI